MLLKTFERRTQRCLGTAREDFKTTQDLLDHLLASWLFKYYWRLLACSARGCLGTTSRSVQDYSNTSDSTTKYSGPCRTVIPGLTIEVNYARIHTTRESHIYPRLVFLFLPGIFGPSTNSYIYTSWRHQPVQMPSYRAASAPSPTHPIQMPHICTGRWLRPVQMWGHHICTGSLLHPVLICMHPWPSIFLSPTVPFSLPIYCLCLSFFLLHSLLSLPILTSLFFLQGFGLGRPGGASPAGKVPASGRGQR
jgi:hypothetical protein